MQGENKMSRDIIAEKLEAFIENQEIAGAVAMVRKSGELVYDRSFGYADIEKKTPVNNRTIFRLASMSKPVATIAVLQLIESGKIGLYDEVKKYLPEYTGIKVCAEKLNPMEYEPDPDNPTNAGVLDEVRKRMQYVPADRELTIFDLLNHSSGLGMGPIGCTMLEEVKEMNDTIRERARKYAALPLDFQPGTDSGYSAVANFEVLAAVIEVASGESFYEYLKKHVFAPMDIRDLTYDPDVEQTSRMPRLYEYVDNDHLIDVTDTDETWGRMDPVVTHYYSASAGLLGSMEEYEKIAHMLLDKGTYCGRQILKPETVEMMAGKGISHESRLFPPIYWGLGVSVMDIPEAIHSSRAKGSFGWSGAYGTHMVVDPANQLEFVLGVNRSNIGGAGSYVSFAVEDAVKEMYLAWA